MGTVTNKTMAKKANQSWNGFSLKPRKEMPDGLWTKCAKCNEMLYNKQVEENRYVCTKCNFHFRIDSDTRIKMLADEGSFVPVLEDMTSGDPLNFTFRGTTYKDRIKMDQAKSGLKEAMRIGKAFIRGRGVVLGVMDPNFLMGSMGQVVGEKFAYGAELALQEKLPYIVVCCSGGARMHEGVVSLGQMAKTSAALARLDDAGGLYIPILTDPTTGGVTASFAMLGDCIIAEPGALIGFAGPRTIAETIKVELPEGFQTAEFMLEHGFVDMIVSRKDMRSEITRIIDYCRK